MPRSRPACGCDRFRPLHRRLVGAGLLVVATLATGCMTTAPRSRPVGPSAVVLEQVPVREFGPERCGAGSLSAVFAYFGEPSSVAALDAELPKSPGGGVLSVDLLLAAREHGYDAHWVRGDRERLRSVVLGGGPAILMLRVLNAPGRRSDYYHYVVVDGIDPERNLFRLQFGDGKARWAPLGRGLRRAWRGAGNAMLVIRPRSGTEPAVAAALRRAVRLESDDRVEEAVEAYRAIVETHPELGRVWTNLGNGLTRLGRRAEAEHAFRRALDIDPADTASLNNLAWLMFRDGTRLAAAERLARRAVSHGGPDHDLALDTLGRILLAQGRCAEAAATFRRALGLTPVDRPPLRADLLEGLAAAQRQCGDLAGAVSLLERALESDPDPATAATIRASLGDLRRQSRTASP